MKTGSISSRGRPLPNFETELVGHHPSTQELRRLILRVAKSPARTVMLYGETGTGKSLVSRLIHRASARSDARFVDVNCAAIPPNLIESELFGHEKGAFTGAVGRKTGLIEAAHRGTLFLDEVSELDLILQAKLLGFLDTQSLRRVGGIEQSPVDVRLIAATNKMLLPEVQRGRFREDLFYRLQLVFIQVPPLRERGEDVMLLAEHYLRDLGKRYGRTISGIDPAVREIFLSYAWPGNVRELAHLLERIFILSDEPRIAVEHLPPRMTDPSFWPTLRRDGVVRTREKPVALPDPLPGTPETEVNLDRATDDFQRRLILGTLRRCEGHIARTAAALGLSRHALRHKMIKLGLRDSDGAGMTH